MKKLLIALLASVSMVSAFATEAPQASQESSCMTQAQAEEFSKANPTQVANQVLCCCNTGNGQCCNYQTFCGGFVQGCMCRHGHSIESEPMDSNGTTGKVKT